MSEYKFETIWEIDAPLGDVWDMIENADSWPSWWRGVLSSIEIKAGDDNGIGSIRRTVWKSALPYKLEFDSELVSLEKFSSIEVRAFGQLEGRGRWTFTAIDSGRTRIQYDWQVTTEKKWMNLIAPVAKPFFRWNHDTIMRWGEEGLKRSLESRSK